MVNTNTLVGIGIGTGIIGMIFGLVSLAKVDRMSKNLGVALDNIEDNIDVEIPDAVVEKATDRAVEKAVTKAAEAVAYKVTKEFDADIRSEVRKAVEAENKLVKTKVKEQIEKSIGYIDISEAKAEVVENAKEEAMEKFKSDLDAVLANHNKELESIQKIYSSIASTMKGAAV